MQPITAKLMTSGLLANGPATTGSIA